jgi:glycosyltransferase involved in cell wall biosynthesis
LLEYLGSDTFDIRTITLGADPVVFQRNTDASALAKVRNTYELPYGPYFLSLHSAAPHKNMPLLIQAYAAYRRSVGRAAVPLVIAGGQGDPRAAISASEQLSDKDLKGVSFLGFVDESDLSPLYSNAQAFFFPSLYEGFGLPVLEALFCGVPVFASNAGSLPEIFVPLEGSDAAADRLLDPGRPEAWTDAFIRAEAVNRLTDDEIRRIRMHFSWERSGAALRKFLG